MCYPLWQIWVPELDGSVLNFQFFVWTQNGFSWIQEIGSSLQGQVNCEWLLETNFEFTRIYEWGGQVPWPLMSSLGLSIHLHLAFALVLMSYTFQQNESIHLNTRLLEFIHNRSQQFSLQCATGFQPWKDVKMLIVHKWLLLDSIYHICESMVLIIQFQDMNKE